MRIAFVMTHSLESPGAVGRFMPLARELARRGHAVTVIALHHDYARAPQRRLDVDGLRVIYAGQMHVLKRGNTKRYFGPLRLLWVTAAATLRMTWLLLHTPCDVVQVCKPQPQNGAAAWLAHKLRGVPFVVDSDDWEGVNNRFSSRAQQRLVAACEDGLLRRAAAVSAGTTFLRRRIVGLGVPPERVLLLHNGVERARFAALDGPQAAARQAALRARYGLEPDAPAAVYVGSVSLVSHALDLLLEAFAQTVAQLPAARLLIVGGGEDFAAMQEMAARLGLGQNVVFAGRVAGAAVPDHFRLGAVTVDPLHRTLPAESSLSLKLVESIAAGTPCITADIGDRRAVADGAGVAVPPDDAPALAAQLVELLSDPAAVAQLRAAAPRAAAAFFWDVKVAQVLALYRAAGLDAAGAAGAQP